MKTELDFIKNYNSGQIPVNLADLNARKVFEDSRNHLFEYSNLRSSKSNSQSEDSIKYIFLLGLLHNCSPPNSVYLTLINLLDGSNIFKNHETRIILDDFENMLLNEADLKKMSLIFNDSSNGIIHSVLIQEPYEEERRILIANKHLAKFKSDYPPIINITEKILPYGCFVIGLGLIFFILYTMFK